MDLQKVKEYLEEIATRNIEDNALDPEWPNIVAKKAIAELEKPEEDANAVAERILNDCDGTRDTLSLCANYLQQYAESYHAKKCEECKGKKKPYKLFGDTSNAPPECLRCGLPCPTDCPLDNEGNA